MLTCDGLEQRFDRRPQTTPGRPSLAAGLLEVSADRIRGDLNTRGFRFESLAVRDVRIDAEAAGGRVFHHRQSSGDLEVDLVVEHADGPWVGFDVKLGGRLIDDAAAARLRMSTRVAPAPSALPVITGTEYGYHRPDGVWVSAIMKFPRFEGFSIT